MVQSSLEEYDCIVDDSEKVEEKVFPIVDVEIREHLDKQVCLEKQHNSDPVILKNKERRKYERL